MKNHYNVEWSNERCPNPHECGRCLEVCPEAVFALYSPNREEGIPPEDYVISPAMQYFCNGCGACLDVCPNNALALKPKASVQ